MTAFTELLDQAAGEATCKFLDAAGNGLISASSWLVLTGAGSKPAVAGFGLGAAAHLASNMLCPGGWDSDAPGTIQEQPSTEYIKAGDCMETVGCDLLVRDNEGRQFGPGRCKKLFNLGPAAPAPNGTPLFTYSYVNCDGETVVQTNGEVSRLPLTTSVQDGGECVGDGAPEPGPGGYDYTYNYEGDECNLTLELQGLAKLPDGTGGPVWKISPTTDGTREGGGGIIGGCNFQPVIYYSPVGPGGPGGPEGPRGPFNGPWIDREPGPDGTPPWLDLLQDLIGGLVGNAVYSTLADALTPPFAGTTYRVQSACELNSNGEPIDKAVEISIPAVKGLAAALERLDAIAELLQPLKDFRQPVCYVKPGEGDARTISFRSVDKSPNGDARLRKRFRYRSKSGKDLGQVIDHWKDFTFNAGSVVVGHSGSPLGPLKVWAASANEGKRVIQHAGAEAGIDPNQVGEWRIGSSDNSRTGMPGVMKVDITGGYWWITNRDGASKRPIVGCLTTSDT